MDNSDSVTPYCEFNLISCKINHRQHSVSSNQNPITNIHQISVNHPKQYHDYHSFLTERSSNCDSIPNSRNRKIRQRILKQNEQKYYSIRNSVNTLNLGQQAKKNSLIETTNKRSQTQISGKQNYSLNRATKKINESRCQQKKPRISLKANKDVQNSSDLQSNQIINAIRLNFLNESTPKAEVSHNSSITHNSLPPIDENFADSQTLEMRPKPQSQIAQTQSYHQSRGFRKPKEVTQNMQETMKVRPSYTISISKNLNERNSYVNELKAFQSSTKQSEINMRDQEKFQNKGNRQNYNQLKNYCNQHEKHVMRRVQTQEAQFTIYPPHNPFHSELLHKNHNSSEQEEFKPSKSILLNNNLISQAENSQIRTSSRKKGLTVSYCDNNDNNSNYGISLQHPQLYPQYHEHQKNAFSRKVSQNNEVNITFTKKQTCGEPILKPNQTCYRNNRNSERVSSQLPPVNVNPKEQCSPRFGKKFKTLLAISCKNLEETFGDDEKTSSNHVSIVNNSMKSSQSNSIFMSREDTNPKKAKDEGDKIFQNIRMLTSKNLSMPAFQFPNHPNM